METRWLKERREKAEKVFTSLPLPKQEEFWRRARLDRLKLERFTPLPYSQNGGEVGAAGRLLPVKLPLGGEFLFGEKSSPATLDDACRKQGVVLSSLSEAVTRHEEVVSKFLGRGFCNRNEKFIAQNEAHWQSGAFCLIPKQTKLEKPILMANYFSGSHVSTFPRLLIILEAGSEATLLLYGASDTNAEPNYTNELFEIYLEDGASLNLVDLQAFSKKTYEIATKRVELAKDAKLKWVLDIQGSRLSKTNVETVLNGPGANAEVVGLICGSDRQQLELFSNTRHITPNTTADILVKSSVTDRSQTVFQGMIRIEKEAQQTQSFMTNNNLVLSDEAHADSIPRLEIEADDVKASHGATIGQVDAEQLFYLRSKGLDAVSAERLLIQGFYEDIFGRIPSEEIRELLRQSLERGKGVLKDALSG